MQKWGFNEDGQTACECGDDLTMKHLLVCPILPQPCTHEDLEEFNPELDPVPSMGGSRVVTREEEAVDWIRNIDLLMNERTWV